MLTAPIWSSIDILSYHTGTNCEVWCQLVQLCVIIDYMCYLILVFKFFVGIVLCITLESEAADEDTLDAANGKGAIL